MFFRIVIWKSSLEIHKAWTLPHSASKDHLNHAMHPSYDFRKDVQSPKDTVNIGNVLNKDHRRNSRFSRFVYFSPFSLLFYLINISKYMINQWFGLIWRFQRTKFWQVQHLSLESLERGPLMPSRPGLSSFWTRGVDKRALQHCNLRSTMSESCLQMWV